MQSDEILVSSWPTALGSFQKHPQGKRCFKSRNLPPSPGRGDECPLNVELLRGREGAGAQQDQWTFGGATRYQGCLLGDFKAEE